MSTYQYYTEECALCGREHPKRVLNKLYISFGHSSVNYPKKICSVCDDCLPELCETFEIELPENKVHFNRRRYCEKCYHDVNASALYCQHCGNKLSKDTKEDRA